MTDIHPTAVVSRRAALASDVSIGPFAVIEDEVQIGPGCQLAARTVVKSGTTLGPGNIVQEGAVLGGLPQHKSLSGGVGRLRIGAENTIRENVTIHRAWKAGRETVMGDRNMLMVNAHVAHDCAVGDETIMANSVMLGGHVSVGDRVYLAGAAAIHQFCRIGRQSMIGGMARVTRDVPPFMMLDGGTVRIVGLNVIGLRRSGFSSEEIRTLKSAYRLIYRSDRLWDDILADLERQFTSGPAAELAPFFRSGQRSFAPARRRGGSGSATEGEGLKVHVPDADAA